MHPLSHDSSLQSAGEIFPNIQPQSIEINLQKLLLQVTVIISPLYPNHSHAPHTTHSTIENFELLAFVKQFGRGGNSEGDANFIPVLPNSILNRGKFLSQLRSTLRFSNCC